ncbi:hypothetical protein LCM19_03175 [Qipengyuania flava]|nr:hypothetical protein [Qipengyuania flava]
MGTEVPRGIGIAFWLIGVPLIIWKASATYDGWSELTDGKPDIEKLHTLCVEDTASSALPEYKRSEICSCMINESQTRGLLDDGPDFPKDHFKEVTYACIDVHVNQ